MPRTERVLLGIAVGVAIVGAASIAAVPTQERAAEHVAALAAPTTEAPINADTYAADIAAAPTTAPPARPARPRTSRAAAAPRAARPARVSGELTPELRQRVINAICSHDWDCGLMVRVAGCESGLRPWARNGKHVGIFQIAGATPGLIEEHVALAYSMWQRKGMRDWYSSRHCWG